jgi:hypothetical protein
MRADTETGHYAAKSPPASWRNRPSVEEVVAAAHRSRGLMLRAAIVSLIHMMRPMVTRPRRAAPQADRIGKNG